MCQVRDNRPGKPHQPGLLTHRHQGPPCDLRQNPRGMVAKSKSHLCAPPLGTTYRCSAVWSHHGRSTPAPLWHPMTRSWASEYIHMTTPVVMYCRLQRQCAAHAAPKLLGLPPHIASPADPKRLPIVRIGLRSARL